MIKNIYLASIEIDDSWDESNSNSFGNSGTTRWFREYNIFLELDIERKTKPLIGLFHKTSTDADFPVHFVVCSPAMASNPPEDKKDAVKNAFIQSKFNEQEALEELNNRLSMITDITQDEFKERLSQVLFVLPDVL